jgi:hypothetical protein
MSHPALGFPVSRSDAGIHTGSKTLLPSASSLQDCVPVTDRLWATSSWIDGRSTAGPECADDDARRTTRHRQRTRAADDGQPSGATRARWPPCSTQSFKTAPSGRLWSCESMISALASEPSDAGVAIETREMHGVQGGFQ